MISAVRRRSLRPSGHLQGRLGRLSRGRAGEGLALGAAYLVTAGYLVSRAVEVRSYIWLIDEFLYTKGALGYAGGSLGGHVYGAPHSVHAPLYSWLLAPIYGLLNSDHAFKAAHAVDALVFAGVLVPAYLTARYLRARPLVALLAALLAVWIPWSAATLVLMSESLAYFAFAWAVWAMVRALAEPSPGRDALALVLVGATAYTRPQFALLFAVFALAAVLCEFGTEDGSLRERLRAHWLLGAATAVALIVVAIAGRSLLGGYSQTAGLPRFPPGLWQNMLSHAAHVIVGAGVLPAVVWLGWALRSAVAKTDRRHYAFALLSALLVAFVFYEVGYFSQNVVGGRIQERTAFYPVLLFALGVAALSADLRERAPRLAFLFAGGVVALVIGAAAFDPAEVPSAFEAIANPGASYNSRLHDAVASVSGLFGRGLPTAEGLAVLALVLGVVVTVAATPRSRRIGVPLVAALALVFCVRETTTVLAHDVTGINTVIPGVLGSPDPPKAWVDGALYGGNADAGALESPLSGADSATVWLWVEFWNKSIDRLYVARGSNAYSDLPALPLAIDGAGGAIRVPLEKPYLVVSASDPRFALQGSVVRRGPFGLDMLKPMRPYRAAWAVLGAVPKPELHGSAAPAGGPLRLAVYRQAGAASASPQPVTVRFTLTRAPTPGVPLSLIVTGGSRPVRVRLTPAHANRSLSLRVTVPAGVARALITIRPAPTRAPSGTPVPVLAVGSVAVSR